MSDTLAQDTEGPSSPSRASTPLVGKFGRYAIEHLLARGGMGVVYLAFDPELERRVALKVLSSDDDESRARLLREARAMARLAHANVVTVFDVGTIDERDFVAMELMEAGTLHDWLHAKPRRASEIIGAFQSAGRGLAAAHAAGLVHRDFKPANVLRGRDGRFKVTDFGLARENTDSVPPRAKLRSDVLVVPRPPSVLDDVTKTGSVLGTPSYMAPEQWDNAVVTPASDQFSFCVALWEAFAGRRPFEATSVDALRDTIERGPRELDAGAIPLRLRGILARGLDPDPSKRWATMEHLLRAIDRAQRRRRRIVAATGGITFTAAVAVVVALSTRPPAPSCGEPRIAPEVAWDARAASVGNLSVAYASLRATVDDDVSAWKRIRGDACRDPTRNALELQCLDGVMARVDAIAELAPAERDMPRGASMLGDFLITPAICTQEPPPRLMQAWSPAARLALRDLVENAGMFPSRDAAIAKPATADDPCGAALVTFAEAARAPDPFLGATQFDHALDQAGGCDERLRVDVELAHAYRMPPDARRDAIVAKVRAASVRTQQGDLDAQLRMIDAENLIEVRKYNEAIETLRIALGEARARHRDALATGLEVIELEGRLRRNTAEDVAYAKKTLPRLQTAATAPMDAERLLSLSARLAWNEGDLATAHARFDDIARTHPEADTFGERVEGVVVDAAGKPVAGVDVVAAATLDIDKLGILTFTDWPVSATSDAHGAFSLPMMQGTVAIALHGDQRSLGRHTADGLRLQLVNTRRITGRVDGWTGARSPIVVAFTAGAQDVLFASPMASDGSFTLDRVPDVPVHVQVLSGFDEQGSNVTAVNRPGAVDGVVLHLVPNDRKLRVEIKSATSAAAHSAFVWVVPEVKDMPKTSGEAWLRDSYARHFVQMTPTGLAVDLTALPRLAAIVCAVGEFGGDVDTRSSDPENWMSGGDFRVACAHVGVDDAKVVLRVAPTDVPTGR